MLTDSWEFGAIDTNHAQLAHLASPSQVKEREANHPDLLV
jgi:hypothetical protein